MGTVDGADVGLKRATDLGIKYAFEKTSEVRWRLKSPDQMYGNMFCDVWICLACSQMI